MRGALDSVVQYSLPIGDQFVAINELLGSRITIKSLGEIKCDACGRVTKKSFSQGYCFPCMRSLAQCDLCIVRPETCHYHHGTCREPDWAQTNCMQQHVVYLANSSSVKVGITRATQIPTRWIDQGASQALPMYTVKNRYHSGLIEVAVKKYVADKTNWRKLLQADAEPLDLAKIRDDLFAQVTSELNQLQDQHDDFEFEPQQQNEVKIDYPVVSYPQKINSLNLDKTPIVDGVLQGVKGQYLMFDCGVLNVRKYTSYKIEISF